MSINILGIESSCDDTSAAVLCDGKLYSNITNTQAIHEKYGGVVPELASRAHQQNIVLIVKEALKVSNIPLSQISAIAFTKGPGLLGSLLVGSSFAKGLSAATKIPLIGVNHLHGHIFAHFLRNKNEEDFIPKFPFLCLLVSGGHTQIIIVNDYFNFEIIGQTIDDAAGEAFDKCAKILGLGYPGGPIIDKLAQLNTDNNLFKFSEPRIKDFDYSFSGFKTSFLYFLRDNIKENPDFIKDNLNKLCASVQTGIIDILTNKLLTAIKSTGISEVVLSGGVSANSGLRKKLLEISETNNLNVHLPKIEYTTDNAAMIAMVGYNMYLNNKFDKLDTISEARMKFLPE